MPTVARAERVADLWERAVSSHPDSPILWRAYLDFAMSNFATFSMSTLRPLFANAVRILGRQKVQCLIDSLSLLLLICRSQCTRKATRSTTTLSIAL